MGEDVQASSFPALEGIIERELEKIVTLLSPTDTDKSTLYEDVLSIVERSLIRIALERSNNVKTAAAAFLGINRSTLHKKVNEYGINYRKIRK